MTTLQCVDSLETVLEQCHGVAACAARAFDDPNVCEEDVRASVQLVATYLETARAIFQRWDTGRQARREAAEAQREAFL